MTYRRLDDGVHSPVIECNYCGDRYKLADGDIAGGFLPSGWMGTRKPFVSSVPLTFCSREHARRFSLRKHHEFVADLVTGAGELRWPESAAPYLQKRMA